MGIITNLAYADASSISKTTEGSIVRLYPNLLRGPTCIQGVISNSLEFRDSLLALTGVVKSKLHRPAGEIVEAILDPLITVTPSSVHYEAFSRDESSYVRYTMRETGFQEVSERQPGCTNVEITPEFESALAKLRGHTTLVMEIGREGQALLTSRGGTHQRKIELPASWMRGFLKVQSSLDAAFETLTLCPGDLQNLLSYLKKRRARTSPRGLKFQLHPQQPPTVEVEPWQKVIELRSSSWSGTEAVEIVLWGRRRLMLLTRVLPHTQSIRVRLRGTGRSSFWSCDMSQGIFMLGLSPWTAREWTGKDEIARTCCPPDSADLGKATACLRAGQPLILDELGWDRSRQKAVYEELCLEGRIIYEPDENRYIARQVFVPTDPDLAEPK